LQAYLFFHSDKPTASKSIKVYFTWRLVSRVSTHLQSCNRKKNWIRLVMLTQFYVSFIALWSQNRSFQSPRSCQFLNRSLFWSSPMLINLG